MAKSNARLEAARKAYREALSAARTSPTPEAWAKLLAAGKDLSAATEPRAKAGGRRARRGADVQEQSFVRADPPSFAHELEGTLD